MTKLNVEQSTSPLASRRYLPWLLVLFVGSGCAALIYEIVWLQLLQLVIGSSGISLGVLLGTFMGGMCLGSLLLPRLISDKVHPLRVYAFLELGIGIIGILELFGMPLIADLYTYYLGHGVAMRGLVAAVCLLPPTFLMGATLPAIARWVETTPEGVSWMGFFYGGNIAGAVFGCLLAGFFLLRVYDMPTATYAAVAINVAVTTVALFLASRTSSRVMSTDPEQSRTRRAPGAGAAYLTIAMSGLCALGAEVVWTRLLSLMLGATVYTFSIILAVFLVGLGIGSSVGALMSRTLLRPRIALGVCQMLLAGAVAWAAFMIARSLPYWPINPSLSTGEWAPWLTFQLDILRAAWAVLPAAMLWGASFPLALATVASRGQDPGRMVGGVYAANTVGAIVGSLAFSMLVIPMAGTQWAQRWLIILSAVSALVALAPLFTPARRGAPQEKEPAPVLAFSPRAVIFTLLSLVIVGFLVNALAQVPWVAVAWGRFSATWVSQSVPGVVAEKDVPVDRSGPVYRYCTYVGEGMNVSVAVTKSTSGWRYFHGAGKVQASSEMQDMRLQRMLGHLSVLARRNPDDVKDVLVVACGAGVTAGSFVPYPNIKRIIICDIEPLVPKVVTPMFGAQNYHIVDGIDKENPHMVQGKQVQVAYDDGRHYIRTLPKDAKFDIITSDPIDPWVKGCAALNTIEYYQMCKDHLNPGGVMSLWIPLYESNTDTAKSVIGTFFKVFPNGILFSNDLNGEGYDAVLLGQAEPTQIDVDRLQQRLDSDEYRQVRESLTEVGFGMVGANPAQGPDDGGVAVDLLATYAGRAADLQEWMKNAQINTDRNLRLQYLAGMWLNTYINTVILDGILQYYRFPDEVFVGSEERIQAMKQALANAGRRGR
ncbi:MAG: fused MFS/spermidine synthase [Acidobacteriia bacterium]|nr:fused MFS/spermidine synthase [Terriglobia bacterium]